MDCRGFPQVLVPLHGHVGELLLLVAEEGELGTQPKASIEDLVVDLLVLLPGHLQLHLIKLGTQLGQQGQDELLREPVEVGVRAVEPILGVASLSKQVLLQSRENPGDHQGLLPQHADDLRDLLLRQSELVILEEGPHMLSKVGLLVGCSLSSRLGESSIAPGNGLGLAHGHKA